MFIHQETPFERGKAVQRLDFSCRCKGELLKETVLKNVSWRA